MELNDIINTNQISCSLISPKFALLLYDNKTINITLHNILLPFGSEKYNDKLILNVELENNNNNNNILSQLLNIENNFKNNTINYANLQTKNILKNKGFIQSIKNSKLGNIIRTHIIKNTEIFLKKKNDDKMELDHINLLNTNCNIILELKGIWVERNTYGLYITVKSNEVVKFN